MQDKQATIQTILIADSNPANLDLFEELLSYEGFEVICTNNGEEALSALHRHIPSLFIAELNLPKMNSFELAQIIRKDSNLKWMPLMAIMLPEQKKLSPQIKEAKFEALLVKPFKEEVLIEKIYESLKQCPTPANIQKQRFSKRATA